MHGKIIGVRFPRDHPIWGFPEGGRASKVRELVDAALLGQVKLVIGDMGEIKDTLKHIKEALARLEERLDTLEVSPKKPEPPSAVRIDPAAFMDL